jgi:hypothetical protein
MNAAGTTPRRLFGTALAVLCLSGCKYSGSFFQMSSDSPLPFFGLQLSVQNDTPGRHPADRPLTGAEPVLESDPTARVMVANVDGAGGRAGVVPEDAERLPGTAGSGNERPSSPLGANLVPTSSLTEFRGRVRHSLRRSQNSADLTATEVNDRLNGF